MEESIENPIESKIREITEFSIRGIGACQACMGCSPELKMEKRKLYLVKTQEGEEYAQALFNSRPGNPDKLDPENTVTVLREINEEDNAKLADRKKREWEIQLEIKQKVEDYEMNMKISNVEFNHDESIIYCYYTAPKRVDFRELVKDLGHVYKKRIEMKQIGAREETRMLGGWAHCGEQLCCNGVFRKSRLPSVSLKMAKLQNLATNPQNLLGLCGKLRCCIEYEFKDYIAEKKITTIPDESSELDNGIENNQ